MRHGMSGARNILIVDDDDTLRDTLVEQLELHEEFEITTGATAAACINHAKSERVDLLILDVGLPDMDGREACRILRKGGFAAPIIMLTGHDTDSDTILGLDAGANDYVTKPFRFAVLLSCRPCSFHQIDRWRAGISQRRATSWRLPASKRETHPPLGDLRESHQ